MVAKTGLEPVLLYRKRILSPQRLPIPPRRHERGTLQCSIQNTILVIPLSVIGSEMPAPQDWSVEDPSLVSK